MSKPNAAKKKGKVARPDKPEVLYYAQWKSLGEIMPSVWHYANTPGGDNWRRQWFKHYMDGLGLMSQYRIVRMLIVDPRKFKVIPKPPRPRPRKGRSRK